MVIWPNISLMFQVYSLLVRARNFRNIVEKAYRWLADNYKPRDRIYLFGKLFLAVGHEAAG